MAVFPVIITSNTPATVTISGAGISYTQFKNSLGSFVYLVKSLYLYSLNGNQVNQVMLFSKYNSNGNRTFINLTPTISPFQESNALNLSTKKENVVLDGLSKLNFVMLANSSLQLQIKAERMGITDYLDKLAETNYHQVETAMGRKDLFANYKDEIE